MAGSNEAKIKFSAETKDFDSAIRKSKETLKDTAAQMKLASAEFRNGGSAADFYQKKSESLAKKLEANAEQQEALNGKIEVATEIYGEDSEKVRDLERQLTYCQTAEQNILKDIEDCNEAIKEQADEAERSESALGHLTTEIESQQTELDALKEEYINAYLEFGATSDEAQTLAGQISSLSGELATNQGALSEAKAAADGLDQSMSAVGQDASESGSVFGGAVDFMSNALTIAAIPAAIGGIVEAVKEIGGAILEEAEVWQTSMDTMANSTGDVGAQLDQLMDSAARAYASTRNMDTSLEEMSAAAGQIRTLFGYTGDELEDLGVRITEFSGVVGVDSVTAVNELYRMTKLWGEEAGTNAQVIDKLTYAAQASGAPFQTIASVLTDCNGAMEGLGMSFDDGVSFLIEYCQAGGDAADVSRILQTAYQNLNGEVDDVPRYFQAALNTASRYTDVNEAMNATIGTTGVTIEDVFGGGKAGQKIVSTMTDGKLAAEDFSQGVAECGGQLERTMLENTDFVDQAKIGWKELSATTAEAAADAANSFFSWDNSIRLLGGEYEVMVGQSVNAMKQSTAFTDGVAQAFAYLQEATGQSMMGCAAALSTGSYSAEQLAEATNTSVDEINAAMAVYEEAMANGGKSATDSGKKSSDAMSDMDKKTKSSTDSAGQSLGKFSTTANKETSTAAKNVASNMKSLENSLGSLQNKTWSTGTVTVPHFSMSGKFDAKTGSVPTVSVSYYAKGGIMTDPTLFGWNNGTAMVGGEAGPEAILPIDLLQDYITNSMNEFTSNLEIDYDKLAEACTRAPIILNGRDIRRATS